MKNRYGSILRTYNQAILDLVPYNPFLFTIGAEEIKKLYKKGDRILEIGSGEGDSALPILTRTTAPLDLLDVSKEMIVVSRKKLKQYKNRTAFICEDAYAYLERAKPYNIIFSAWTVHNFKQSDKKELIKAIFQNLDSNGAFVLFDKVYPPIGGTALLALQNKRYERYALPKVAQAIIAHEREDAKDVFRMDEKPFIQFLKEVGFKTVKLIDRVERDVIIVARK